MEHRAGFRLSQDNVTRHRIGFRNDGFLGQSLIETGYDIAALFENGEVGAVILPGTSHTDCYTERSGASATTLCTDGDPVGTIHDKINDIYLTATADGTRLTYRDNNERAYFQSESAFDCLFTTVDATGGDEAMIVMGLERPAAAGFATIAGLGNNDEDGNFNISKSSTARRFLAYSRGVGIGASVGAGTDQLADEVAADVVTGLGKISGDTVLARANGTDYENDTADQGTGNYGNFDFGIGALKGKESQGFVGDIYGLIARFQTPTEQELSDIESLMRDQIDGVSETPVASAQSMSFEIDAPGGFVAGEQVFFRSTATGFDQSAPTGNDTWDGRHSEIYYIWDFGRDHTFSKLENVPDQWKNGRNAYGRDVSTCFNEPGTYSVTVTAIDRSGNVATHTQAVIITSADAAYPTTQTICFAHDGDYTGAPTGHQVATGFGDAYAKMRALKDIGLKGRIMLKGGTYDYLNAELTIREFYNNWRLETWDGRATLDVTNNTNISDSGSVFVHTTSFTSAGGTVLYKGIDFVGPWDAEDETGNPIQAVRTSTGASSLKVTINDCTSDGMQGLYATGGHDSGEPRLMSTIFDCASDGHQNYGCFFSSNTYLAAVVGSRIKQNPQANMGGGLKETPWRNDHGCIRIQTARYTYVDAVDLFTRNGWLQREDYPEVQPCIRYHSNTADASYAYMGRISAEGGNDIITSGDQQTNQTLYPVNFVIDKAILVSSSGTGSGLIGNGLGGLTIRNVLGFIANNKNSNPPNYGFGGSPNASEEIATNIDQRIARYGNTLVSYITTANQTVDGNVGTTTFITNGADSSWTNEVDENNILIATASTQMQGIDNADIADFDQTVLFAPRHLGHKFQAYTGTPAQVTMDTSYATPTDTVKAMTPQTNIARASSGLVPFDDLYGTARYHPSTYLIGTNAAVGAIEV